jgi:acetyl esterase/lipase
MKIRCVAIALGVLWAVCWIAQAAEVKALPDVTYGEPGGVPLKLDAFLVKSEKPTPVLIFIHGGGWRQGDKRGLPRFLKEPLFEAGISVVSINYRLTDVAPYPAQVDDCTRAVQFVRSKAKEWNINPERIALMGASAGGHLSLWVGLHNDRKKPDSADSVERQSFSD